MPSASDFHHYTSSSTIKITVGTPPHHAHHNLYTSLLRDKSLFFAAKIAALHPNPKPTIHARAAETISISDDEDTPEPEHVICLPALDANAFQQFVQWLYAKPFDVSDLSLVCATYLLGHAISCEEMRNDLVDAVRWYYRKVPLGRIDMGVLVRLCEGLPPGGAVQGHAHGLGHGQWRAGAGAGAGGNANVHGERNGDENRNARGNGDRNQNQNRTRNGTNKNNGTHNNNHNNNDGSNAVKTHKQNKLLELLVAQLTYKILVRGWDTYKDSVYFKTLMKSSIEVAMWHLDWLHRLNDGRYSGRGGIGGGSGSGSGSGGKASKRFKSERERDGETEDADAEEDMFFDNQRAKKGKCGAKMERGGGVGVEGWENPAALRGCVFHEHKEVGSVCKTPDDLFDDE